MALRVLRTPIGEGSYRQIAVDGETKWYTNAALEGLFYWDPLWVDYRQVLGTMQFNANCSHKVLLRRLLDHFATRTDRVGVYRTPVSDRLVSQPPSNLSGTLSLGRRTA